MILCKLQTIKIEFLNEKLFENVHSFACFVFLILYSNGEEIEK